MKKFILVLIAAMVLAPICFVASRRMYPELRAAVNAGDALLVERALKNGADPNLRRTFPTIIVGSRTEQPILCTAAAKGNVEVVRLLINYGAAKEDPGHEGLTPIGEAARHRRREVVQLLCEQGVDVSASPSGGTALTQALMCGDFPTAEILIRHGALKEKPGVRDVVTQELLHVVGGDCNVPALRFLIANGVDVSRPSLRFAPDSPPQNRQPGTALDYVRRKIEQRQKSLDNLDYQINGPRKAQLQDRLKYEQRKMAVLKEAEQVLLAAGAGD